MLVLAPHVTQARNDKEPAEPMVARIEALPKELNHPKNCWATPTSSGRATSIVAGMLASNY